MDYDRIILEMLNRIKQLEDEVEALKSKNIQAASKDEESGKISKKYRKLTERLFQAEGKPVRLSFSEIENVIGFKLPDSARVHRAFWANTTTHSIALSWLYAGYKTVDVDIENEMILFER